MPELSFKTEIESYADWYAYISLDPKAKALIESLNEEETKEALRKVIRDAYHYGFINGISHISEIDTPKQKESFLKRLKETMKNEIR